ncbi:hypothetical protein KAU11_08900 [Candidatus Babeliales bacterium]|nr:hypothetical protein [Candidatus Babeliales bacterium]
MDFNRERGISKKRIYTLVFVGVVLIFVLIKSVSTDKWNKWLKNDINDNIKKSDSLELLKIPILKEIKDRDKKIVEKDSVILVLTKERMRLLKSIKYYRNENFKLKNTYLNNSLDKRIELFSRLAKSNE